MYCPRCSQQQSQEEVRFCSRCGFQLTTVSQLLKTDGVALFQTKEKLPLVKRPDLRKRGKQIFLSFCLFVASIPLMGILDPYFPFLSPFIIGIPFFIFLVSILQLIYHVFFGESILPTKNQSFAFNENSHQLNYQSPQGLALDTSSFDTSEFIPPPSVTEPTTNLIKNKYKD